MPTTTRGYRYPASSASPNVPADIQNLASDLDADVAAVEARLRGFVSDADEPRTAQTSLSDSDLTVAVAANTNYAFKIYAPYTAIDAADLKYDLTFPAGSACRHTPFGPGAAQVTDTIPPVPVRAGISVADGSGVSMAGNSNSASATVMIIEGSLRVAGTAGNLTLRFAQVASSGTATIIKSGAYIMLWELP